MNSNGKLSSSYVKIDRAAKHLHDLEAESEAYIASKPARWTCRVEVVGEQTRIIWSCQVDAVPVAIGAIVGDVIHNLRSALDLATCEMSRLKSGSDKDVCFPFADSAEGLEQIIKKRNLQRIGDDGLALVRRLQPYKDGNGLLRAMHDLDIQDKHVSMIPGTITTGGPIIDTWAKPPQIVGDPNAATHIELVFPERGPLGREPLIPKLQAMKDLAKSVIDGFAAIGEDQA